MSLQQLKLLTLLSRRPNNIGTWFRPLNLVIDSYYALVQLCTLYDKMAMQCYKYSQYNICYKTAAHNYVPAVLNIVSDAPESEPIPWFNSHQLHQEITRLFCREAKHSANPWRFITECYKIKFSWSVTTNLPIRPVVSGLTHVAVAPLSRV